jgi:hypothetical protein
MQKIFNRHPQLNWNRNRTTEDISPADIRPAAWLRNERAAAVFCH